MILAAHIITGAALASVIGKPELALPAAFFSHYVLDAVPHREYAIEHMLAKRIGPKFFTDLGKVSVDAGLGFLAATAAFSLAHDPQSTLLPLLLSGVAAAVPDLINFLGYRFPRVRLLALQVTFHHRCHIWKKHEVSRIISLLSQGGTIALAFVLIAQ